MRNFDPVNVIFVCALLSILFGIPALGYYSNATECRATAEGLRLSHDYGWATGCRLRIGDKLVPSKMIRITDTGDVLIEGGKL